MDGTPVLRFSQSIINWGKDNRGPAIILLIVIIGALVALSYTLVSLDTSDNQSFALVSIGNRSINEGSLLQFSISAKGTDDADLMFSASNLPEGAEFNPDTRSFSWTPTYAQAGVYPNIHFEVTNGKVACSEDIAITVNQQFDNPDVNHDGDIDALDIASVREHCGETGTVGWIPEDVNEDGIINVLDMISIAHYSPS